MNSVLQYRYVLQKRNYDRRDTWLGPD
jgi:hypothetical protein